MLKLETLSILECLPAFSAGAGFRNHPQYGGISIKLQFRWGLNDQNNTSKHIEIQRGHL